jgi:carbon starvation protein
MLFVTVACGAVSGFHALISSGTSSKQVANERHIKIIGYGAMLTEGLVAVLALISAAILFGPGEDLGFKLKTLSPIGIFAQGYDVITRRLLGGWGQFIAITILNAFILTTLDTATRISRYLTQELFGIRNRYISTLLVVILGSALAFSGQWNKIWPVFGASNQLVAALTLFVLSCWLLAHKKKTAFTVWPAIFMLFTAVAALTWQAVKSFAQKEAVLFVAALTLIILAVFMVWETISSIRRHSYA